VDSVGEDETTVPMKRIFDLSVASLGILFSIPLLLLVALTLLIVQGRPILIRHTRVGRGGRRFSCFKFRTMVKDAEAVLGTYLKQNPSARREWEASHKLTNDPRITWLGGALRKSSVDELPQLLNVIRGDMSLVGPRPIVEQEIKFYGSAIHQYYRVRPGLTGLWQVSGRSDVSYASRVSLDVDYVQNATLQRDMLILLRTVPAVLSSRGSY
jgi:exopolysaccharide production protein ExoY